MALKSRCFMYTQQLNFLETDSLNEIIESRIEKLEPKPVKYAGIIHDKDLNNQGSPVEAHVHIVFEFKNARYVNAVSSDLDEPQERLEIWKGQVNNAYSYLVHKTTKARDKHQYDLNEVLANFDYTSLMDNILNKLSNHNNINDYQVINYYLDMLYEGEITKVEVEEKLSGSQLAKASRKINDVYRKRLELDAVEWRINMRESSEPIRIIWIYGKSKVGKTRIAKEYAKTFSDNYYISGSTRDPFQNYQAESVVILDELRPEIFEYSDLLKMLDPYSEVAMGSSRYFDKPLLCSVFIITSPFSPKAFYDEMVRRKKINSRIDSFLQLARRITMLQQMTEDYIRLLYYDEIQGDFVVDIESIQQNPYTDLTGHNSSTKEEAKDLYRQLLMNVEVEQE